MRLALYIKKRSLSGDTRIDALRGALKDGGCELYDVKDAADILPGTDALRSLGGDGTFLSAARLVGDSGVPVLGVNFGRLGFLSEYKPEEVVAPLLAGAFTVESRSLLRTEVKDGLTDISLNEMTVHRKGAAMLGVDVTIDGESLPTGPTVFWWPPVRVRPPIHSASAGPSACLRPVCSSSPPSHRTTSTSVL